MKTIEILGEKAEYYLSHVCRKNHTHTQTWHFRKGFVAGYKVHTYFDCSIGAYLIDGLQS